MPVDDTPEPSYFEKGRKQTSLWMSFCRTSPCEMVWWFGKSSEQYRVEGELQLVGATEAVGGPPFSAALAAARKQQWGELAENAREQFF